MSKRSQEIPDQSHRTVLNISETTTPGRTSPTGYKNQDTLSGWVKEKPRKIESSPEQAQGNGNLPVFLHTKQNKVSKSPNAKVTSTLQTKIFKSYIPTLSRQNSTLKGYYLRRSDLERKNPRLGTLHHSKSEMEDILFQQLEKSPSQDVTIEVPGAKLLFDQPKETPKEFMKLRNNAAFQTVIDTPRGDHPPDQAQTIDLLLFKPKLKPKHLNVSPPKKRSLAFLELQKNHSIENYSKQDSKFSLGNPGDTEIASTLQTEQQEPNPDLNHALPYKGVTHNPKRFYKQLTSTGPQYSRKTFLGVSVLNQGNQNILHKISGGLDNKLFKSPLLAGDNSELSDRTKMIKEYLHRVSQSKLEPVYQIEPKLYVASPKGYKIIDRYPPSMRPRDYFEAPVLDVSRKESKYTLPSDKISVEGTVPRTTAQSMFANLNAKGVTLPRLHGNRSYGLIFGEQNGHV